jgi:glycerol-3-phosphate dehydrogenase (NAD(P)+)
MTAGAALVVGGGSFGTAVATLLARGGHPVRMLVRSDEVATSINRDHENPGYHPGVTLDRRISATTDAAEATGSAVAFWAVPSNAVESSMAAVAEACPRPPSHHVVLAKGLHERLQTLDQVAAELFAGTQVASLKGPTFSLPLLRGAPSGMTLGTADADVRDRVRDLFAGSTVVLDDHPSAADVELVSALKNVYAVALGIIASYDDAENTLYTAVVRILKELRALIDAMGHSTTVLDTYCGVGDLLLTGLSDRSRNRTLGVMIGKGFGLATSGGVLVEGRRTADVAWGLVEDDAFVVLRLTRAALRGELSGAQFIDRFFGS